MKGVSIPGFKLSKDGTKIEPDHAAREAKLDVSTRIKRRSSKKVTVASPSRARLLKESGR